MPSWKAPQDLFWPEFAKAQVKPFLDMANLLLEEVLHYGLALFTRCGYRPEGDDENLPILFVYLHLLEMLDSVAIQVGECAPAPAALQLRAMFESLLAIEYLTQDRSKTRERAMAYLYKMEIQRREFYLSQNPNTREGKRLLDFIKDDPYAKEWKGLDPTKIAERVGEIDKILDTPEIKQMAGEYQRLQKKYRDPQWYSFFGGPASIAKLAQSLKRGAQYRLLYTEWSQRIHSSDAIDRILTHNLSGPAARALRDAGELESAVNLAITFMLDASRALIRYFRPGEETAFSKWYAEHVSTRWKNLPKLVGSDSSN